jgi:hypothetical protein
MDGDSLRGATRRTALSAFADGWWMGRNVFQERMLRRGSNRQHFFQDAFQRHGVAADSAQMEKLAIALPVVVLKPDLVIVVVAAEGYRELVKMEAIGFLGIPFGLLDFSDHSVIHVEVSFGKKKARGRMGPVPIGIPRIVDLLRAWRLSSGNEGRRSIEEIFADVKSGSF